MKPLGTHNSRRAKLGHLIQTTTTATWLSSHCLSGLQAPLNVEVKKFNFQEGFRSQPRLYVHTCIHAYIHTYIHTYIHVHIHVRIHIIEGGRENNIIGFLHYGTIYWYFKLSNSNADDLNSRLRLRSRCSQQRPEPPRGLRGVSGPYTWANYGSFQQ